MGVIKRREEKKEHNKKDKKVRRKQCWKKEEQKLCKKEEKKYVKPNVVFETLEIKMPTHDRGEGIVVYILSDMY